MIDAYLNGAVSHYTCTLQLTQLQYLGICRGAPSWSTLVPASILPVRWSNAEFRYQRLIAHGAKPYAALSNKFVIGQRID